MDKSQHLECVLEHAKWYIEVNVLFRTNMLTRPSDSFTELSASNDRAYKNLYYAVVEDYKNIDNFDGQHPAF